MAREATSPVRQVAIAIACASSLLGLAACGQKGPLYLPDQGGDIVTRPAGSAQRPAPPPNAEPRAPANGPESRSTEDEKKDPQR